MIKNKHILIFVFLFASNSSYAYNMCKFIYEEPGYEQWFTGPLLTPNPTTLQPGHPGLETSFFGFNRYGLYDKHGKLLKPYKNWQIGTYFDFQIGFNKIFGAEIISAIEGETGIKATSTYFQDTILRFGIQILNDKRNSLQPDFRILLQETFPTGNYQKLKPYKYGSDITGDGSYKTGFHLAFQKLFIFKNGHKFRLRWTIGYFFPSKVFVKGINTYGGSFETRGTVNPGNYFIGYLTSEYSLSKTWSICCESKSQLGSSGSFQRKAGPYIDLPHYRQISLAPELGHTLSKNSGLLFGSWFTIDGVNAPAFQSYFVSYLRIF